MKKASCIRRRAPIGLFALVFLLGTAFAARASVLASPHQTLDGIAGQSTHGIVAAWMSNHQSNHFTAEITWGDALAATAGQVSANGQKSFDAQGTHVYAAPGTYYGMVHVVDLVDQTASDIAFTAEIRGTGLVPIALSADDLSNADTDSDVDGIFEFGETIVLNPSWSTATENLNSVTAALSNFHRIGQTAAESYSIVKETADYGSIAKNDTHDCLSGNDKPNCYALAATLSGPRPAAHMDARVTETLIGNVTKTWTLHMGGSFIDVPANTPYYPFVESIFHNGVTVGCAARYFCPNQGVLRDQMAAFLARGFAGSDAAVPATGTVNLASYDCSTGGNSLFTDVAADSPFCRHIHYIASQSITLGCGPSQYCPNALLPRSQAAIFIARSQPPNNPGLEGDVPMAYSDPNTGRAYDCNVASANVPFSDVPATDPSCRYVSFVWARGIIDGFADGTFRPAQIVTREQAAKFLDNGLALNLYQP
ncbi:MAG TPA: S-layer homology domain-containing protein [Thermoanaerobaculia bacterium]|nr:S-layer homology domain-containing protein [Thermoanaerobaculia bacterium]